MIEMDMLGILVVDDGPLAQTLISHAFESDGFACHTAGTVLEAANLLARERIDGIVIDLERQGESGISWLEHVYTRRPSLTRRTVVATTADLGSADRRRIARVGAVLLLKPFSLETLRSIVRDLTARGSRAARHA